MERSEMKRRAVNYYNENQVPKQLETLLNTMFAEEPTDIYGYMAEYFKKLSKPISISKVTVESVLSNSGYDTLKTGISCIVNGLQKDISSLEFFKDGRPLSTNKANLPMSRSSAKQGGKKDAKGGSKGGNKKETIQNTEEVSRETPLVPKCTSFDKDRASMYLMENFIPHLIGSTLDEEELDERLRACCKELKGNIKQDRISSPQKIEDQQVSATPKVDEPSSQSQASIQTNPPPQQQTPKMIMEAETEINMVSFLLSTLCTMCKCKENGKEFYSTAFSKNEEAEKRCPMPAMSFFSSDYTTPGKLCMIKELLVVPKPSLNLKKSIEDTVRLYRSFENTLSLKFVANGMIRNGRGVLTPSFDKIEQIFEFLIQSCRSEFDCDFAEKFDIILDVGANGLYDVDKKKYEVCIGSMKTSDEMITMYSGWIQTYSIIALIDSLSLMDNAGQASIYEELAPHCYIITSQFTDFDHVNASINETKTVDGILLQPELYCQTLSEVKSNLKELKGVKGILMMTDDWTTIQTSSVSIDMAYAMGANFLRISSPTFGGASNLQRYLDIFEKESDKKEIQCEPYVFRVQVKNEENEEGPEVEGDENDGER